ncbi:MAG: PD-(D/E)XK nuclease family protein [Eubacteriales bacterium]|nr:PD-(D/E)XK nuclease family protein [Eubacteriales bacterium]
MSIILKMGAALEEKTASLLYQVIQRSEAEPATQFIWFSPEQMSMDIEKRLILAHPRHALVNIRVYGLHRFARQCILSRLEEQPVLIDEIDKMLLLEEVVQNAQQELGLFKQKLLNSVSYLSEVKSMVSEFQQYCVTPEALEEVAAQADTPVVLKGKLADLAVIYRGFLESLGSRRLTGESLLERAAAHITADFSDTVVIFDGFTGFTPQQYSLIEALLPRVRQAIFSIPEPEAEKRKTDDRRGLFVMGEELRRSLGETADRLRLTVTEEETDFSETGSVQRTAPLVHLRRHLFGRAVAFTKKEEAAAVHIRVSDSVEQEVNDVLLSIRRDVTQGKLRFRDIGIITTDPSLYQSVFKEMKERLQIPVFLDERRPLLQNPLISAVFACLEIIGENYRYEAVLRFLESGFADISDEESQTLERFMLRAGIRGRRRWERLIEKEEDEYADIAVRLMKPLFDFHQQMVPPDGRRATVADRTKALRNLLRVLKADDKLQQAAEEVTALGYMDRAAQYRQCGEKLSLIFDKLETMLGSRYKSVSDFTKLLLAAVSEVELGLVPTTIDAVAIGDLQRSRFSSLQKLYILGCHEGAFDGQFAGSSLLNMIERDYLSQSRQKGCHQLQLAPTEKEELARSRYYTYMAFTGPQRELVLSYSRIGSGDKMQLPAQALQQLKKMFADCEEEAQPVLTDEQKDYAQLSCELKLTDGLAASLYQNLDRLSPTSLELYAKCPYQFFQKYGLGLAPEKEFEVNALDIGMLLHSGMEQVVAWIWQQEKPSAVPNEAVIVKVDEVLERLVQEESIFTDSSRNLFLKDRLRNMLIDNLHFIRYQIDGGSFIPTDFEKEWCLQWGNEEQPLTLTGKIDRVDTYRCENGSYARVIDYKSGATTFSPGDLMAGVQIQLPLYLAALYTQESLKPAGMYYYQVKDPIKASTEPIEAEELFRLSGPTNEALIEATDHGFNDSWIEELENKAYKSKIVAVEKTSKGQLHARSVVLNDEEFDTLFTRLRSRVEEYHGQIHDGEISARPIDGGQLICSYCSYRAICRISNRVNSVVSGDAVSAFATDAVAEPSADKEAIEAAKMPALRGENATGEEMPVTTGSSMKALKSWLNNESKGGETDAVDG